MVGVLWGVAWVAWGHSESSFCPSSLPGMHVLSLQMQSQLYCLQGAVQLQSMLACVVVAHAEGPKGEGICSKNK